MAWIMESGKSFVIIGTMNAISYKEIFPLIKENKCWLGNGFSAGNAFFAIPTSAKTEYAQGVYDAETGLVKFRNCCWFTNIDHGRRHQPLDLMTMEDNIMFSKHKEIKGKGYLHYDNCDAIEVPFSDAIPIDYEGLMGVPITFFDKYCPDQFIIEGITKTWYGFASKTYEEQIQVDKNGKRSVVTKLNDGAAIELKEEPKDTTYYIVGDKMFAQVYARILIRKRK